MIFNDYPTSPGFFGSNGDGLVSGADEQLAFSGYLERASRYPRYSKLSREFISKNAAPASRASPRKGLDKRIGYNDGLDELSSLVASALVQRRPEARSFFDQLSSAELAVEKGVGDRYADGSSEIFDSVWSPQFS